MAGEPVRQAAERPSAGRGLVLRVESCSRGVRWRPLRMFLDGVLLAVNNGKVLGLESLPAPDAALPCGMLRFEECWITPDSTGLHDRRGLPIRESLLCRDSGACLEYPLGVPESIRPGGLVAGDGLGTVVWIPKVNLGHFGHLLTETAGWLAPLLRGDAEVLREQDAGAVLVVGQASPEELDQLGRLLGWPRERMVSTRQMGRALRCRLVLVPQPTCINRRGLHGSHLVAVRQLVNRLHSIGPEWERRLDGLPQVEARTYLSRSRLPAGLRKIVGEAGLEEALAGRGWRIVHPERLSIGEQLAVLKTSRVLAGNVGSALHLLMYFGRDLPGTTVIGLGMASGRMNLNFTSQFRQQGLHFRHLCCLRHTAPGSEELRLTLSVARIVELMEALASGRR